jgi:hypothetical protein
LVIYAWCVERSKFGVLHSSQLFQLLKLGEMGMRVSVGKVDEPPDHTRQDHSGRVGEGRDH